MFSGIPTNLNMCRFKLINVSAELNLKCLVKLKCLDNVWSYTYFNIGLTVVVLHQSFETSILWFFSQFVGEKRICFEMPIAQKIHKEFENHW